MLLLTLRSTTTLASSQLRLCSYILYLTFYMSSQLRLFAHAASAIKELANGDLRNQDGVSGAGAIPPLVSMLPISITAEATHEAAHEVAAAGGLSAVVEWLDEQSLGPPEVAAHALSEIASAHSDMQTQIVEEGALASLVAIVASLGTPDGLHSIDAKRAHP